MKVINFQKNTAAKEDVVVVLQPDFHIKNYATFIRRLGDDSFRVEVGCFSTLITKSNIDILIEELKLGEPKKVTKTFIVAKSKTKATASSPVFLESSKTMHISQAKKCYSIKDYHLIKGDVVSKPTMFSRTSYNDTIHVGTGYNQKSLSTLHKPQIQFILDTIKAYYCPKDESKSK